MMAMLLAGVVSNRDNATIGGGAFWWQCYYRDGRQMVAMQRKELNTYNFHAMYNYYVTKNMAKLYLYIHYAYLQGNVYISCSFSV